MVCDLRTISFDVPPQEILTKDSVTVAVDAVIYYKINSPMVKFMTCLHEFSKYESTNFFNKYVIFVLIFSNVQN